jgi:ABC-type transport system involved in Fe-S cluster assembly fused permease/ATPase subunit
MNDPRGDIEIRFIRKMNHICVNDLVLMNELIIALASPKRNTGSIRHKVSEKLIKTVQEIKQLVNSETIEERINYPKKK